ncbi:MAG: DUF1573 domain-containing protein [Planctomycetia bacterium]|nr:DUF1573 domain-containing protein [Planctomycetia bacterium]
MERTNLDVGEGIAGDNRDVAVVLTNVGRTPVTLVGATSSCGCISTDTLPLKVPARGLCQLSLHVGFSGDKEFHHEIVYYTDRSSQPCVTLAVSGKIRPSDHH